MPHGPEPGPDPFCAVCDCARPGARACRIALSGAPAAGWTAAACQPVEITAMALGPVCPVCHDRLARALTTPGLARRLCTDRLPRAGAATPPPPDQTRRSAMTHDPDHRPAIRPALCPAARDKPHRRPGRARAGLAAGLLAAFLPGGCAWLAPDEDPVSPCACAWRALEAGDTGTDAGEKSAAPSARAAPVVPT